MKPVMKVAISILVTLAIVAAFGGFTVAIVRGPSWVADCVVAIIAVGLMLAICAVVHILLWVKP